MSETITKPGQLASTSGHRSVDLEEVVIKGEILFARLADFKPDHPDYPRIRERIIELFLPFAQRAARRFQNKGESFDDLVQVAYLGLVQSVDRYDPQRGSSFLSFALPTITGELKRYFRDKSWTVHVPRRLQEIGLQIAAARSELTQRLEQSPTTSDFATHLGITEEEVLEALDAAKARTTVSWHTPVGLERDDAELGDLFGEPDDNFTTVDERETVRPLIANLTPREQHILHLRFYRNLTQSQIGQHIGVSQMQVSRLLSELLHRLRSDARAELPA